jgi:3-hydroxyacyl-CoA dehydrogenase
MPWAGGPFGWLDLKGSETIIKICNKLEITYGKRYQVPNFLKELNKKNQGFYEVFNY